MPSFVDEQDDVQQFLVQRRLVWVKRAFSPSFYLEKTQTCKSTCFLRAPFLPTTSTFVLCVGNSWRINRSLTWTEKDIVRGGGLVSHVVCAKAGSCPLQLLLCLVIPIVYKKFSLHFVFGTWCAPNSEFTNSASFVREAFHMFFSRQAGWLIGGSSQSD